METDRLRWFLEVTKKGGIRPASEAIGISPGAISKAIRELETSFGQQLFVRSNRSFSLTDAGLYLQSRAAELVRVEDEIRAELGHAEPRRLTLAGTEPLLALYRGGVLDDVGRRFPALAVDLRVTRDEEETERCLSEPTPTLGILARASNHALSRALSRATFGTFVGRSHSLSRRAGRGVPVAEVTEHAFVVPARSVFGAMPDGASSDGWRDDEFPRRRRRAVATLALTATYVEAGHAVAYLPQGLAERLRVTPLKVLGCPYRCTVDPCLVASASAPGWLRQLV